MLVYIGIFVFHISLIALSKFFPKKKIFVFLSIFLFVAPLLIISSLKSINVGIDTAGYYDFYNLSATYDEGFGIPTERGYFYLMKLFKSMNAPFFVFLFFCYTIFYLGCSFFSYRKSDNPLMLLFFMSYFGLLGFSLSAFRQTIAIGIVLFGFSFFDRRKPVSLIAPIIATALAIFFHKSSFTILPLAIIVFFEMKRNAFIYFLLACLIVGLSVPFIYSTVVLMSANYMHPSLEGSYFTLLIYALFGVLLMLLSSPRFAGIESKLFHKNSENKVLKFFELNTTINDDDTASYRTVATYLVFPILILIIGAYSPVFARIMYFTIPFTGVLLINTFNKKQYKIQTRVTLNVLLVVFLGIYFGYSVLIKDPLQVANYSFGPIF